MRAEFLHIKDENGPRTRSMSRTVFTARDPRDLGGRAAWGVQPAVPDPRLFSGQIKAEVATLYMEERPPAGSARRMNLPGGS